VSVQFRRPLAALVVAAGLLAACGSDDDSSGVTAPPDTADVDADTGDTTSDDTPASADCPPDGGFDEQTRTFDGPPPECLDPDATYEAIVTTNKGEFTITLDPASAPVAANNFAWLAGHRYFDDTECHRIIPDFVVQCGDPTATGTGGPGYTIVDEPPEAGAYEVGSVAMAKTQAPDSAGSQFFIITGANGVALPPEYALFGQVTAGFDTAVEAMAAAGTPGAGTPSEPIVIESVRIAAA
jgi:cyclophilin family peptidyl-prolyl cis-trans isomerase